MPSRPNDPVDVVFVGQLPPPVHGQSLTNAVMADGAYERLRVTPVPMRFSDDVASVGRFRLGKLLRVPALIWAVFGQWRAGHREVLVYTIGAKNRVGVARDLMVLPFIRPLFRRTVFFMHTGGIRPLYDRHGLSLLARLGYGRADVVIHTDASVAGPDDQLPAPKRIAYLAHGISHPSLTPGTRNDPPVILFVGNLYPSKGTHDLVRAGGILAERGLRFEIRFVGAPPTDTTNADLTALAREHGIRDQVQLVGPVGSDDIWQHLSTADIFCFPTHYEAEAWPIVVLEAMAASLPVVSTRWRAIPAMVEHDGTGLLVEPNDYVALADCLAALVADLDRAQAMGRAGRASYDANFTKARFEAGFERIVLEAANADN
jgi:glycosyltransferase involved in cell wall biosynthesis